MDPLAVAKDACAALWNVPVDTVFAEDIASLYPWVKRHRVYIAGDPSRRKMLVAVDDAGAPLVFENGTKTSEDIVRLGRLSAMNSLLEREGLLLPNALPVLQLAEAIRNFMAAPGGWVGSSQFRRQEAARLAMWIHARPNDGAELFEKYCAEPTCRTDGDRWILDFHWFNLGGGVEAWHVEGDSASVHDATSTTVLPARTFLVPYG